jgi:uncharacterized protein (TIGR04255 family)
MSKLPNAPLVEVIFEIRWNSTSKVSLDKFQLLLGSMYTSLKADFPSVTNLRPDPAIPFNAFVGMPTHRFSRNGKYPMYQLGPGILSINMVNSGYVWESFIQKTQMVVSVFEHLSELQGQKITLAFKYLDFFKCKFSEIDLTEYIKNNFHLSIDAPYLNTTKFKTFSFATSYDVEIGTFTMTMNTGYNNIDGTQVEGIITETNISKEITFENLNSYIIEQLPTVHEILGNFFKEMTKGKLYESFK